MVFWRRLWRTKDDARLQEKLLDIASEFCLEASVLISVLGILDSAVSVQRIPSVRVFVLSFSLGAVFYATACIIQMLKISGLDAPAEQKEEKTE